jgi:hypothetical protein
MVLSLMNMLFCQVYVSHIILKILLHYTKSSVSTGFAKQIMLILCILCYNGSLVTRTVESLTTTKFTSYIFCVLLRLILCCEHVHSHDFVRFLLVSCTILTTVPVITPQHGPHRKHLSSVAVPLLRSCLLGFPCDCYSACLLERWLLLSNGCLSGLFRGRCIATGL